MTMPPTQYRGLRPVARVVTATGDFRIGTVLGPQRRHVISHGGW